jgi:hypothetical protein
VEAPQELTLATSEEALEALRARLRGTRWPDPLLEDAGWGIGIAIPPRSWAQRTSNLVRWTEMPSGGHFAPFEEPELYVDDLRAFFRPYRTS